MSQPPGGPARRVRVTSPRFDARRRKERLPTVTEFEEQTGLGAVYLGELLKAQMLLGAAVLISVLTTIAGLPLLFLAFPHLRDISVLWIPLPWFVVGAAIYPVLYLEGRIYLHQCERVERDFAELVSASS